MTDKDWLDEIANRYPFMEGAVERIREAETVDKRFVEIMREEGFDVH